METKAGRLILPHIHIMQNFERREIRGAQVTGILFPHLLEQMVAAGALEVFVTDAWRYKDVISQIPESVRKYVHVSDISIRAQTISNSFFETIFAELEMEHKGGGYYSKTGRDLNGLEPVITAHSDMSLFFEAFFLKSHFHFDINAFVGNLKIALALLRSSENRVKVTSLISALSVYKNFKVAAPDVIAVGPSDKAQRLRELILTEEYRALSRSHFGLGVLGNPAHLIMRIDHQVQKLLSLTPAKAIINYSSKAASVAVGTPLPDSQMVESFVCEGFLPPAIDLTAQIRQAVAQFKDFNADVDPASLWIPPRYL